MSWTVVGTLRKWAKQRPDAPMLTGVDTTGQIITRTWREQDERASRVGRALAADGVGPGDRIAFLDKNGLAYYDVLFGAGKVNAVDVAVNWRLAPPEMAQVINDAGTKVVVVGSEFLPQLAAFEDQLTTVKRVVVIDGEHDKHVTLEEWLRGHPADDAGVEPDGGDVAVQFYTSGTTGLPKGVMLTNTNLGALLDQVAGDLGIDGDSVSMAAMPLFHIGGSGWSLIGISQGAHTVLVRDVDPALVLSTLEEREVTHAFLIPAVLQFMLQIPGIGDRDLSHLRSIAYGASPISEDVLGRCLETFGCEFVQLYGLTETTGAITILRASEHSRPDRLRSCGVPFPHIELRIVDATTGADRAVGEVGELWTRSSQNMLGYFGKPEETARTIDADGWLKTGDAGYLDGDGFVYLHDRIKDMVVSGGENVYPAEVENVLMSHPGVADAAVIGVPDQRWGETVKAIIVAADPPPVGTELIAYCRERLAHFKCPTSVDFIDALPRNPSGKILKRELRAPYWQGQTRNIS
ncbi:MAG: long-chain-fatty-acid--CoA ligase [Acidimicrobiales bacterium]